MNAIQIIVKTIASTIDLLIALIIAAKGEKNEMKISYTVFCFLNLIAIWC